ncbi:glutamate-cysteine ligase family protein [Pseudonocardia sp. KRD291]|uniref:glutamate-cysteine ligase family protein n=1 Tax=Pseudonocardia sp. KRD291 TaxID=2792007 RepID=UPI001C49F466|nr:glutamate-cysteine ligase family protein [Pseudonocardia sp. KRD291]MBW0102905.1 glutamate--cysteine ligase [Pseudonocardia sp. KRD291]
MRGAARYGIEHEVALLRADGTLADFTSLRYEEVAAIVAELPEDPDDRRDLRIGDAGIRRKRWYAEGFERFDDDGRLVRFDPKGIEIRTRIHDDVDAVTGALVRDLASLSDVAGRHGLHPMAIGFNPLRSVYPLLPPLTAFELAGQAQSPEERTAHLHMVTYGPDLNLSFPDAPTDPATLADAGAKLTHLSPYLVPLSFSSPFRDGREWGGLSARTSLRTGPRPAVLVYLDPSDPLQVSDPTLTRHAGIPAEVGRIEFKAFDACPDPALYAELLSLLTGLLRDTTLPGRRTTPDAALHRRAAVAGLDDPQIRAGADAALSAAAAALSGEPEHTDRLERLRVRLDRRECPAHALLTRHRRGEPVAGLPARTPAPG